MATPHDWRDLQIALALREHGSLTKVAALLGISPSTVSRRLDGLEAQLGAPLPDPPDPAPDPWGPGSG